MLANVFGVFNVLDGACNACAWRASVLLDFDTGSNKTSIFNLCCGVPQEDVVALRTGHSLALCACPMAATFSMHISSHYVRLLNEFPGHSLHVSLHGPLSACPAS